MKLDTLVKQAIITVAIVSISIVMTDLIEAFFDKNHNCDQHETADLGPAGWWL